MPLLNFNNFLRGSLSLRCLIPFVLQIQCLLEEPPPPSDIEEFQLRCMEQTLHKTFEVVVTPENERMPSCVVGNRLRRESFANSTSVG